VYPRGRGTGAGADGSQAKARGLGPMAGELGGHLGPSPNGDGGGIVSQVGPE
jgi:hypothetical protein